MSLLYKSLQKLRKEEQNHGPRYSHPSWYSHKSENKRLLRVSLIALGSVIILVGLVFVLQSRFSSYQKMIDQARQTPGPVTRTGLDPLEKENDIYPVIESPEKNQKDSQTTVTRLTDPDAETQKKKHEADYPQEIKPLPQEAEVQVPDFLPADKAGSKSSWLEESLDQSKIAGSQVALDKHFADKAARNREVMVISRTLQDAFRQQDMQTVKDSLARLKSILSDNSPLVLKWSGVLSMTQGDMETARTKFEQVLKQTPADHDARANLALVLSSLGHDQQARRMLDELKKTSPDHPLVMQLSTRLKQ